MTLRYLQITYLPGYYRAGPLTKRPVYTDDGNDTNIVIAGHRKCRTGRHADNLSRTFRLPARWQQDFYRWTPGFWPYQNSPGPFSVTRHNHTDGISYGDIRRHRRINCNCRHDGRSVIELYKAQACYSFR